ncbi:MAG: hypothetical protein ACI4VL_05210, partial [Bacilli bacterium]
TEERGIYSSDIEPNPNEHKIWFNTNTNTLNIYENGKWNGISGSGSGGGSTEYLNDVRTISMNSGYITGVTGINMNNGYITGVTGINVNSGLTITGSAIANAIINSCTLTGSISASGASINDVVLNNVTGINLSEYASLTKGSIIIITYTGSITNPLLIPNGGNIGNDTSTIKISDVYIKGGVVQCNSVNLISGSNTNSIKAQGSIIAYNGILADSTLFHSINLGKGDIKGVNSIKSYYSGLTIEPESDTSTEEKITIHGRAAGLSIGVNSTASFTLDGISSLNWKNGNSNGYMMTFNTNNNTLNSNFDNFNISNAAITLSGNTISGSINGNGLTISNALLNNPTLNNVNITSGSIVGISNISMSSGSISGVNSININNGGSINASNAYINDAIINGGNLSGSISASGATIDGGNLNGPTLIGAINASGAVINTMSIKSGGSIIYGGNTILAYTGSVSVPMLMPYGGSIAYTSSTLTICGVALTGGDFQKLKDL